MFKFCIHHNQVVSFLEHPVQCGPLPIQFFYFLVLLLVKFPRKQRLKWRFGWMGREETGQRVYAKLWWNLKRNLSPFSGEIWRWVNTSKITSFQVRGPGFYTCISVCDIVWKNLLSSINPIKGWKLRAFCLHHGQQVCFHSLEDIGQHISVSLTAHPSCCPGHILYNFWEQLLGIWWAFLSGGDFEKLVGLTNALTATLVWGT